MALFGGHLVAAQNNTLRVEYATVDALGNATLHVTVPRGQEARAVTLTIDGSDYLLRPEPVQLDVEQWLVLDASGGIAPIQQAVQEAVKTLVDDSATTGILTYNQSITTLSPANASTARDFLSAYTAVANSEGCLWDALDALPPEPSPTQAHKVIVITTALTSQMRCNLQQAPANIPYTVDVIQVSDTADDALQNIALGTNGSFNTVTLRSISDTVNRIRLLWAQPTYRVQGMTGGYAPGLHAVTVQLASGNTLSTEVRLREVAGAAQPPTASAVVGLATVAQPTSAAALATVAAPSNGDSAVVPTNAPPATVAAPSNGDSAAVPTNAPPATVAAPSNGDSAAVPTTAPLATVADAADSPPPTTDTQAPTAPDTATQSAQGIDPIVLMGGGFILVAILILAGIIGYNNYQNRTSRTNDMEDGTIEQTHVYDVGIHTVVDAGAFGGAGEMFDDDPEWTGIVDDDEEELMLTGIADDDELQQLVQNAAAEVIGWVRISGMTQDYPIARNTLIGRGADNDIALPEVDSQVSRHHAILEVRGDDVYLKTNDPKAQIVMKGRFVTSAVKLNGGDVFHLSPKTQAAFITKDTDWQAVAPQKPIAPPKPTPTINDDEDDDFDDEETLL